MSNKEYFENILKCVSPIQEAKAIKPQSVIIYMLASCLDSHINLFAKNVNIVIKTRILPKESAIPSSIYSVSEKNWNPTRFMIKQLNLNKFIQNLQEVMLNNLAVITQNFVRKFWKFTELLIVQFFGTKITISNVCPKKNKKKLYDYDYDYIGRFLLRFHTLIDVYRTSLAQNQFLN